MTAAQFRPPQHGHAPEKGLRLFVARYGWRAYALPILTLVTIAAVLHPSASAAGHPDRQAARTTHPPARSGTSPTPRPATTSPAAPMELVQLAPDSTVCMNNTASTYVLVSISQQHVWMCERHRQVYTSAATTGATADNDATPTGSWLVQSRETDRYLVGPGYRDYVRYWIPFDGDVGFHDASWQTMPFGSPGYRTQGSHGCVHLPLKAVAWLYRWALVGSTVVTVTA